MASIKDEIIGTDAHGADANVGLSENALRVLRARYLKKDENGQVTETPKALFDRVAGTIADVELSYGDQAQRDRWAGRFYDLIVSGRFMPNSPTLMNAGREMGMLSACFVLPVRDSVAEIFDSIKNTALIQKAGGGTGFAFDELRPTGDYIRSSGGTTSGPISFWRAFSEATNAIQQGAFRRGANMGMMYIHHPDILKFLFAKQDLTQFTNYNISVKLTDPWMEAFLRDADAPHVVRNPRSGQEYLIPKSVEIAKYDVRSLIPVRRGQDGELRVEDSDGNATAETVARGSSFATPVYSMRDIWDIIVKNAHQTGEPGVVFIDRINEFNPTPKLGRIEATNPCGEQPLLPYEACNLGSINLAAFVRDACTGQADVDWDGLRETVYDAVRFLDNVIDANNYPLPQIEAICKANRKVGLGVMGFADALFKLGVCYSSEDGVAWGERFMKFIDDEGHNYSEQLAAERGSFANWAGSIWDTQYHRPMRNAAVTTVAPTGTISIIAGCSGGIEPMFSLAFFRNVLKGQDEGRKPMVEVNPIFAAYAAARGLDSEGLMDRLARDGTLAGIPGVPADAKHIFVCAHDITPDWHVRMQAAFQRHCDASISKTINFPHDASVADVDTIYRLAYQLRCKGVTVYRDGCRTEQPMALKKVDKGEATQAKSATEAKNASKESTAMATPPSAPGNGASKTAEALVRKPVAEPPTIEPRDIPEIVSGFRIRQMTPFGNMHVKITVDPRSERELEVFAQLGKGGDIANSDLEAICRLISLWLRAGGALRHVIRQLRDIGSSLQVPTKDGKIMSLGDGLARALQKYTRAKERFGLRALLLGECDLASLDRPAESHAGPIVPPTSVNPHPGNGNGNGNGKNHTQVTEVRHAVVTGAGSSTDSHSFASSTSVLTPVRLAFKVKCPSCGEGLVFAEGCNKCHHCGWAQC
ncbi:MAG TPA: vitamin B12-dependent ribonucleotide reductase [Phycisphaerae bacterium]|nr:vitamin B12-dependent ribonucleotide reductase [Phycisphaerae bacterium]HRY68379.1 vitamin B12-dependent ribonucleotide reductase [Phycisphaerae bacterium]HSA27796.1 vitamin B12-dependent ribonucleotide reductase [Phycisphaerae bacterium]